MVENRGRESAKIILETGYFLSEMISDLIDSPPTSPSDTMSNSKLRDCLKAAQSNNKEEKKSKLNHDPRFKTKDKSLKSHSRDRGRKRDRRKPGREKLAGGTSREKQSEAETKEQSTNVLDKNEKQKQRYENTIIDNIVISAFRSWEDLQDEVNERISANRVNDNQCNQTPIAPTELDHQGSTSQSSQQLPELQVEQHLVSDVLTEVKPKVDSESTNHPSNLEIYAQYPVQSRLPSHLSQPTFDHKKKRHRERAHDSILEPRPSLDCSSSESLKITSNDSPKMTEWVPGRDLSSRAAQNPKSFSDVDSNFNHYPSQLSSGKSNQRPNPSIDFARREFEAHLHRVRQQQLFGPQPLAPHDLGYFPGNAFHQKSPASIGPQFSSANQYLHNYLGANSYNQHMRDSNPCTIPASNQSLFPPHPSIPGPSSLTGLYTSPYTITDTIISRQTIIPPSLGVGRFNQLPGFLSAIEPSPAPMMRHPPSYVPSPTERSFMEFARSYASANSITGFMNQSMNPSLNQATKTMNPSFGRFSAEQRGMGGAVAHNGLQPFDPSTRLGSTNYHNEARPAINPAASFYPHLFR